VVAIPEFLFFLRVETVGFPGIFKELICWEFTFFSKIIVSSSKAKLTDFFFLAKDTCVFET